MSTMPSENPTFKLRYFNLKALGEPIRMLFAYGGIEYEDIRVESSDWPALKPNMPMGQLPVLEVDGQRIYQSNAISRYLAKRVGLAGSNDWESLQIAIAVDNIADFRLKMAPAYYEKDEEIRKRNHEQIKRDIVPFFLEKLDKIAEENDGYLALSKLTWADFNFVGMLDYFNYMMGFDLIENSPNLKRVVENVSNVPQIKTYLEKRPSTRF